ncbi:SHOCT domain-containing protein [Phenylobacterium sp.]|uniref:SHOCT domain-containing protein n=1 Tax=Phenylobacterium sp. TaxID=1871053 RepID=UPI0035AF2D85
MWSSMMGYGWPGGWFMLANNLFWLVVLAVAAVLIWRAISSPSQGGGPARSSALHILEERYARGEIQREEYLEKKKDLGGA